MSTSLAEVVRVCNQNVYLFVIFVTIAFSWPLIILSHYNTKFGDVFYALTFSLANKMIEKGAKRIRGKLFSQLEKDLLKARSTGKDLKVLEVGPGTGENFAFYPEGLTVSTLELNEHLQQQQDDLIKSTPGLSIDQRLIGNLEDLEGVVDDATFDVVIATHVICCLDNKDKGLKEIYRILKPGGKFYAFEFSVAKPDKNPLIRKVQQFYAPVHRFIACGHNCGSVETHKHLDRCGFDTSLLEYEVLDNLPTPYSVAVYGVAGKQLCLNNAA